MTHLVEINGDDGRIDYKFFEDLVSAENRYYRALGAVSQGVVVKDAEGKTVKLIACRLFDVPTEDPAEAKRLIANNEAVRLQDSDDRLCGDIIVLENLFRVLN